MNNSKERIYTIPVNDAFNQKLYCPFCAMQKKIETDVLDFVIGPSYMDEDVRDETNAEGFCAKHTARLYEGGNRLGLALILHTRLKYLKKITNKSETVLFSGLKGFFNKNKQEDSPLKKALSSCYVCKRANATFERYIETFFYMLKTDGEFFKTARARGFCFAHFDFISERAKTEGERVARYREALIKTQKEYLEKLDADLEWFTKKFDYRYANEPWGDSQDALIRVIKALNQIDV